MEYTCEHGHWQWTPEPKTIDRCLAWRCKAPLTASGDGSRAENERLRGIYVASQEEA